MGGEIIAPGIRALCHPPGQHQPWRGSGGRDVAVARAVPGPAGASSPFARAGSSAPTLGLSAEAAHPTIRVSHCRVTAATPPAPLRGRRRGGSPRCTPRLSRPVGLPPTPRQLPPPPAATGSSIPSRLRGPSRCVVTRGLVPRPPRQGSAAWRSPARGAAEPPPPGGLRGTRALSLMQCYEYRGSFCRCLMDLNVKRCWNWEEGQRGGRPGPFVRGCCSSLGFI